MKSQIATTLLIIFSLFVNTYECRFSQFLEKISKIFIEELDDVHYTNLYDLEELQLYSIFQVNRFSIQNLENTLVVSEIEENQSYEINIEFPSPDGTLAFNNEKIILPIQLKNATVKISIEKLEGKQAFRATSMEFNYEDISFNLGVIGYIIPDSVLRGDSMKSLIEKVQPRAVVGFNRFLSAFDFMKFKHDSMVLDMEILFESEDNSTQQQQQEEKEQTVGEDEQQVGEESKNDL